MTKIILTVNGAKARAAVSGPLTSGMTGIPVTIEYDEAWDGLTKTLVCRCGQWGPDRGETRMMGSIEDAAVVAHEVMKPDMHLYLGVEGYSDDGKLVIPSTWADCGRIQYGANAQADPSTDPALPVWAQLQSEIRQLRDEGMTEERVISIIDAYQNNNSGQVPGGDQNTGQTASHLSGKYLSLLGDSISTYPGYIPEGYSCYYAENFMNSVTYMWWHRLMTALGMNLCVNNAYSGSCVAVKAGVADGYSGCQTVRNMRLHTGTTVPDMIIVQMGTNDYVQKVPIGDYDLDDGEVFDTSTFMGAYAKMLWNISSKYPNTKLYCATLLKMRNVRDTAYPVSGMEAYNDAIRRVADLFGAGIIDFSACGITPSNVPNYMVDSRIHPNKDGQALMGNQAIAEIAPYFATRYGVLPPAINNDAALDDGDEGGSGGSSGETEVTLTKISVVYSGGDVPVGTDVSELTGVVVTAHYSDGTTAVVTGYEMSGTIEEGKNTIIVTYQRKLASFSVTGVAETGGEGDDGGDAALLYDLDLTKSLVDSIGSVTATLSGDGATRDANGVAFTAGSNKLDLGIKTAPNTELTFYFGECNMTSTISAVIVLGDCIFAHTQGKWQVYDGGYGGGTATDVTLLNNATIQVTIASDGIATIRMGDVEVTSLRSVVSNGSGKLTIGNGSWSAYPINLKRITVKELI